MTTLLQILAATLLSSVLSIVLAGLISFKFLDRYMSKMLCISAGLLLTVAFTHLLPEAFEIHENAYPALRARSITFGLSAMKIPGFGSLIWKSWDSEYLE